jgi:hypothetical protein
MNKLATSILGSVALFSLTVPALAEEPHEVSTASCTASHHHELREQTIEMKEILDAMHHVAQGTHA